VLTVVVTKEKVRWVLGVGKSKMKMGGDEVGARDERSPCPGNALESDE
jgi:hypothetical protein